MPAQKQERFRWPCGCAWFGPKTLVMQFWRRGGHGALTVLRKIAGRLGQVAGLGQRLWRNDCAGLEHWTEERVRNARERGQQPRCSSMKSRRGFIGDQRPYLERIHRGVSGNEFMQPLILISKSCKKLVLHAHSGQLLLMQLVFPIYNAFASASAASDFQLRKDMTRNIREP